MQGDIQRDLGGIKNDRSTIENMDSKLFKQLGNRRTGGEKIAPYRR